MKIQRTNISIVKNVQINLASSKKILELAERVLPNGIKVGEITSSQTVNYKTLKPEKNGLFCERIFGPLKDFECACGKKKPKRSQLKYCPDCDVEYTYSKLRRHRLGYINLVNPVTHIWFLKGRPCYLSLLLNLSKKKLLAISYCTESLDSDFILNEKNNFTNSNQNEYFDDSFGFPSQISKTFFAFGNSNSSWELDFEREYFTTYMTASKRVFDFSLAEFKNGLKSKSLHISNRETLIFSNKNTSSFECPNHQYGGGGIEDLLKNIDMRSLSREIATTLIFIEDDLESIEEELRQHFAIFKGSRTNHSSEQLRMIEEMVKEVQAFLFTNIKYLVNSRTKLIRRFKVIRNIIETENIAESMIISILPVLPPDLRPIIQLEGDQVAVSDLNKLYQKVIFRNNRIAKISQEYGHPKIHSDEIRFGQRLVQEAVDALIENGKSGSIPVCGTNDRPLKSLSDILKGKQGRFRQNLLGKRVDYSGRSVIVVGPKLKLQECGLPKEIAIELFQPFLIKYLKDKKLVRTIIGAKRLIDRKDNRIWKILEEVLVHHPILLNRAPTLHRVGFQAFQPKLIDGKSILLHPLVCTGFNADFDGDQMAIHVPLSIEARAEAWTLMWSRNNILSPATGQPFIIPSQDMVLGLYYLTNINENLNHDIVPYFSNLAEAFNFYNTSKNHIHSKVWVRWLGSFETNNEKEKPIEIQIQTIGSFMKIYSSYTKFFDKNQNKTSQYIQTTIGRIIVNKAIQETAIVKKESNKV